jgi:ketosteroid isomerase-like protein
VSRAGLTGLAALTVLLPAPALAAPAPPDLVAELRGITQQLLDAVAPGNAAVWDRYLDPDLISVDENGVARGKAALLRELTPLPPGLAGSIRVDSFRVSLQGDTAIVAHEDQEQLDYYGQPLHSRFRSLDVWRRTGTGWRLVGQQISAVLRDPPALALSQAELCAYAGRYRLTDTIVTTITCEADGLVAAREGRPPAHYRAEARDVFFAPGQPRSRRIFRRDAAGRIIGFADRREGEDIVWRREG